MMPLKMIGRTRARQLSARDIRDSVVSESRTISRSRDTMHRARTRETFVSADTAALFIVRLVEPTRLRILNCVAAAPLFVADLATILGLPQPTVSEHLRVLHDLGVVHATSLPPHVLYQFEPGGAHERLVRVVLDTLRGSALYDAERTRARLVSRAEPASRRAAVATAVPDAP